MLNQAQLIYVLGLFLTLCCSFLWFWAFRAKTCSIFNSTKHFLNAFAGLIISLLVYGQMGTLCILTPIFIIWLLKPLAVSSSYAQRRQFTIISWIFLMVWLCYWHFVEGERSHREYKISFTNSLMLVVAKMTMLVEDLAMGKFPFSKCTFSRFWGYAIGFNGYLAGPLMPFSVYLAVIEQDVKGKGASSQSCKSKIMRNAFVLAGQSVCCALAHLLLSRYFSPSWLISSAFVLASPLRKAFWIWGVTFSRRLQYYFAWRFAEACGTLTGFCGAHEAVENLNKEQEKKSLNSPKSAQSVRDSCPNIQIIKILDCELASSSRDFLANWHISTAQWLHDYVYLAVTPIGQKPGAFATIITHLTSALWHGLNFGYYFTFLSTALNILAMRILRKKTWFWIHQCIPPVIRRMIGILATQFFVCSFFVSFILLRFDDVMAFERAIGFAPQIVTLVILGLGIVIPQLGKRE